MDILNKLVLLEEDARAFGFNWPHVKAIIDQLASEVDEVRDAIDSNEPSMRVQEEIGDVLHDVISLCVFLNFDVKDVLLKAHDKFARRMAFVKEITQKRGLKDLRGQSIEFMLKIWDEAKVLDKG